MSNPISRMSGPATMVRPSYGADIPSVADSARRNRPLLPSQHPISSFVCTFLFWTLLFGYTLVILVGDSWLLPSDETAWCRAAKLGFPVIKTYANPDANTNPCYNERTLYLLGMSPFEVDFSRRMIVSVVLGAAIGYERKAADRPAGVRTMSLVSLGSCFFTMCGQFAFRASTQEWDAARVSAAIPSGVGFLGSALIWKHGSDGKRNEVHGLTTAASVWLSAAVGIGAGGRLYVISTYAVALVIVVLRLGPRMYFTDDSSSQECDTDEWDSGTDINTADEKDEDDKVLSREEQRRLLEERSIPAELVSSKLASPRKYKIPRGPSFHG